MGLTSKELKKLNKLTTKEKGIVWCKLNSYKCPKPFKYLKHVMPTSGDNFNPHSISILLMQEIEDQIGSKETSRAWWKYQSLGSKKQHDKWFKNMEEFKI